MNDPLGLFGEEEQTNADPLGLFGSVDTPSSATQIPGGAMADQYTPAPELSFADKAIGVGEAGLQLASSLPGMVAGPLMGIQARTRGASMQEADAIAGKQMESMTYAPRTEAGQEYSQDLGEFINRYLVPVAPLVHMPSISAKEGFNAAKAKMTKEQVVPKRGVDALLEEVKHPAPAPVEAPIVESRSGLDLTKQAYEQALREKELQRQSAFNRPDELATLEAQAPMERMASDLGATEKLPVQEAPSPMGNMARDLTEHSTPEARAAQEAIDLRQKATEFEVAKQGGLDFNAAERARQEVAPLPPVDPLTVAVESHPAVKAATAKVASTEKTITVLEQKVASGEAKATQLIAALKQLEAAKAKAEKATTNVASALAKTKKKTNTEYEAAVLAAVDNGTISSALLDVVKNNTATKQLERVRTKIATELKKTSNINYDRLDDLYHQEENIRLRIEHDRASSFVKNLAEKKKGPDEGENPYNSDIVNMHSGIPFTREHWNKLREVGNAMIENAQQAIAFAQNVPDVQQNMVQRGINALTKGGSYLKAKVNSPVVHFAVDRLLAAEGAAKSAINERIHGEYLGALRELSKAEYEDAYKILNQADQTQKAITKEAMTRHGISEKVQNAVLKHQELMADVLTQVNAAREAAGKKPITAREGYAAMNMTGDFRKVVYKTINGVREVVGVISANSKTFGKNSLTKLEKLIGEKNPEYEFGPLQDLSTSRTITKGTPDAAFMDVLNTIGENNPNFAEFLKTLDEVHRDNPSNFLGMQQHAMQKKGVWGMEGRKQWLTGSENAKSFFENQVRYAESAYQWGEFSKAGLEISEVLHDPVVLKNHPNASKLAQEYLNNAMGLQTSRMGKAVDAAFDALFAPFGIGPSFPKQGIRVAKEVANIAMMSLSPTFLAIQLLQPVASLPGMVMYLRGKGMDSWAVAGSAKAMGTLYKISTGKPLNAIERGAVEYAKKNHVYATDMVQHSMDTQKGPLHYTRTITQAPQAHIETGTRASVFHTLVQTLHDGGLTPEKGLYEQAQRFTDLAMNNYSNMEKPMIYNALGPLGSMAFNLKNFAHNEISRWSMYAREIPNSGDAKPLLAQMATTIAFAGLMGLPFYSQWEQLYGFITKKLGEPRSLTLDTMKLSEDVGKHLGPKGAYALSHGMFATVGADISSRIGLGDVIPSSAADAAFAGGGKLVEMGKATGRAMMNPSEENLKSAATNLAPPFLQGVAKDAWYTKGDLGYSIDPTNLKPTAKLNDQDKLLGKIGILGINKSVQQTKNYELGQLDREFKGIRDKAMNTIAQDIFRDRAVLQKTIDKYFIDGQGDPKSFEAEVNALATKMNLSPNQLALLRDSASNSITRQRSLMRRVQ